MPLSSKERAQLRGLAHPLKPAFHVGKEGVTTAAAGALREGFNRKELLKVRVLEAAPDGPKGTATALAEAVDGVEVIQVMGRTVTLYRPSDDA